MDFGLLYLERAATWSFAAALKICDNHDVAYHGSPFFNTPVKPAKVALIGYVWAHHGLSGMH